MQKVKTFSAPPQTQRRARHGASTNSSSSGIHPSHPFREERCPYPYLVSATDLWRDGALVPEGHLKKYIVDSYLDSTFAESVVVSNQGNNRSCSSHSPSLKRTTSNDTMSAGSGNIVIGAPLFGSGGNFGSKTRDETTTLYLDLHLKLSKVYEASNRTSSAVVLLAALLATRPLSQRQVS